MRIKISLVGIGIFACLGFLPQAIGAGTQRVGQFDFSYLTSGALRATPVQVFDDGNVTYFQFRAGEPVPAIFQNKNGKVDLLVPTPEGPYFKVESVGGHFTLQLGRAQASVVYASSGRDGVPPISAVASNGMKAEYTGGGYPRDRSVQLVASLGKVQSFLGGDAVEANSYATPVKGDVVSWQGGETESSEHKIFFPVGTHKLGPQAIKEIQKMAAALKSATRVTIVGRDDESYKEGLDMARSEAIREAVIKYGVQASKITLKTGVQGQAVNRLWPSEIRVETVRPTLIAKPRTPIDQPAPTAVRVAPIDPAWTVLKNDANVERMLTRWSTGAGWRVIWEKAPEILITADADRPLTHPDFLQAAEFVLSQAKAAGYKINGKSYSNNVLVIKGE